MMMAASGKTSLASGREIKQMKEHGDKEWRTFSCWISSKETTGHRASSPIKGHVSPRRPQQFELDLNMLAWKYMGLLWVRSTPRAPGLSGLVSHD